MLMINALVWNHWSLSREVGTAISILLPLDSALRLVRCWKSIILINVQLTKIGTAICHLKVWYLIFKLCRWKRWKQTWLGPSRSVRSSPRSSCGNWTTSSRDTSSRCVSPEALRLPCARLLHAPRSSTASARQKYLG